MADHQSEGERENVVEGEILPINQILTDDHLMTTHVEPWFADVLKYMAKDVLPEKVSYQERRNFISQMKFFYWEEPYLYKQCTDNIIRRCAMEHQMIDILEACHTLQADGHHSAVRTAARVLQSGFFWPTLYQDAKAYVSECGRCRRTGNMMKRHRKPMNWAVDVDVFDAWEIELVGPFEASGKNRYILFAVDYLSRWVEAVALPMKEAQLVIKFLKKSILNRWGPPRVIISQEVWSIATRS